MLILQINARDNYLEVKRTNMNSAPVNVKLAAAKLVCQLTRIMNTLALGFTL